MYDERKRNDIKALYEEYGSLNTVDTFLGCNSAKLQYFLLKYFSHTRDS